MPLLGLVVLMAGCNKGTSIGEKKTVSEVDQLLTKKGQQFESDDYVKFTVTSPNHLSVKDTVNGNTNDIVLKPSGTTSDKEYAIYQISATGLGAYKYLDGQKAAIFKRTVKHKDYITLYSEVDNNGKKEKLDTQHIEKYMKNEYVYGSDLRIE